MDFENSMRGQQHDTEKYSIWGGGMSITQQIAEVDLMVGMTFPPHTLAKPHTLRLESPSARIT